MEKDKYEKFAEQLERCMEDFFYRVKSGKIKRESIGMSDSKLSEFLELMRLIEESKKEDKKFLEEQKAEAKHRKETKTSRISTVRFNGEKLPYTLIRSNKRRTISLNVKAGELIVRAPVNEHIFDIELFIESKYDWILRTLKRTRLVSNLNQEFWQDIWENKRISLLGIGTKIPISLISTGKSRFGENELRIYLRVGDDFSNRELFFISLIEFIKKVAKQQLLALTKEFASKDPLFRAKFQGIRISSAKTKWGTCRSDGIISLNWKLMILTPLEAEYVICHELCHLAYMNHSSRFWQRLRNFYPSMDIAKTLLEQNVISEP